MLLTVLFYLQKLTSQVSIILRQLSDASTDLKAVLAAKVPKEQERVKNFRKTHGNDKVGEVTVDMVSYRALKDEFINIQQYGSKVKRFGLINDFQ